MGKQGAEARLLTPREAQVFELIARGLSDGEIAEELAVGVKTVEAHAHNAEWKLGASRGLRRFILRRQYEAHGLPDVDQLAAADQGDRVG